MSMEIDPDWWKTLFDEVYLVTDARSVCNDDITRREIDLFCDLIPLKPADRILDLCGGHGRHAIELSRRGFSGCTVLDYSLTLLKIGAERAAREGYPVDFIQGDARRTAFGPETQDHVMVLGNSLGYSLHDDSDLEILREGFRVLKSGGWLLIDVTDNRAARKGLAPNAWHEIGNHIVVCRERELRADTVCIREMVLSKQEGLIRDKTYSIRLYRPQQLSALVTRAGFAEVHSPLSSPIYDSQKDLGCMNHRLVISAKKPSNGGAKQKKRDRS